MGAEHRRTAVAERTKKIVVEAPVVLTGKNTRLTLGSIDVVTLASRPSDVAPRMGDGVTQPRGCSPLSNCACPDASVPVDACKRINTEPGAHTCAPQCVEED